MCFRELRISDRGVAVSIKILLRSYTLSNRI